MRSFISVGLSVCSFWGDAVQVENPPALVSSDTIKLPLINSFNAQYYVNITVGGQRFPGIVDSGSPELLVLSNLCEKCKGDNILYDSGKSSTFNAGDRKRVKHMFGSGMVIAEKDFETVQLGITDDSTQIPMKSEKQPFWQMVESKLLGGPVDNGYTAIIGFGFTDKTGEGTLAKRLKLQSFAFCFNMDVDSPSWLTINPSAAAISSNMFDTMPVIGQGFWAVKLTDFQLGDHGQGPCNPSCAAIVDSGTSLMAAPRAAMDLMAPVLGRIALDCSNVKDLPDLKFKLGGFEFTLPPSSYVLEVAHLTHLTGKERAKQTKFPARTCIPAFNQIKKNSEFGPVWILGLPFLRRYYSVFDSNGPQLHIAKPENDDCTSVKASSANRPKLALREGQHTNTESALARVNVEELRLPAWATEGPEMMVI